MIAGSVASLKEANCRDSLPFQAECCLMPLPAGFAELLLEELGRPALVFEGRNLCLANKPAVQRWGDPPNPAAPPVFLAPLEWEKLGELLSASEKSLSSVTGQVTLLGVSYSIRCTVSPDCPSHILCIVSPDVRISLNANVPLDVDPVDSTSAFCDERVRDLCLRQLLERTKICDLLPGDDFMHIWTNSATDRLISGVDAPPRGVGLGKPSGTRLVPQSLQQFADGMKSAIAEGSSEGKMHMVWKSGHCRSLKMWFSHISGRRVGWFVQPVGNADELADSLEFMRSFFENAPYCMAVAEVDERGTDYTINGKNYCFGRTFGTTIKPATGGKWSQREMQTWIESMITARDSKSPQRFEVQAMDIGGAVLDLLITAVHIRDQFFAVIIEDVTRWKEAQAKVIVHSEQLERAVAERTAALEEALQVKNRFLAVVSHELRTPVAGVLGTMELLGETLLNPEQQTLLSTARTCGEQLSVVINDILDFTRIQENKVVLEDNVFSLHLLLEEVLDISVFNPARRPAIELVLDIDSGAPNLVKGDVTRLRQILLNLVSNAIKFTEQGEVHVTLTKKGENLNIDVRDTGIGIAPDVRYRLFHPFQQADTSVTRRFGGSGLGLCISKNLAQLMGGDLTFTSDVDAGTVFSLCWPAKTQREIPFVPRKELSTLYVITITGNATLRAVLSARVIGFGCQASSYAKCDQAMEAVVASPVFATARKVLLVDADLASGLFFESLRRMADTLCVLLGYDYSISSAFLKKPVKSAALLTILEEATRTDHKPATPGIPDGDTPRVTAAKFKDCKNANIQGLAPPRHALRILVAEDNPSNQFVLRKYLDLLGYVHCTVVENGLEALKAVEKQEFDIILMDVMMPVMGGIEATERILGMHTDKQLPLIVALTAHVFKEDQQRCLRAGMAGVLTKPIRRSDLQAVLEKVERERYT